MHFENKNQKQKEWLPGEKITGNFAAEVLKEMDNKKLKIIDPFEKEAIMKLNKEMEIFCNISKNDLI